MNEREIREHTRAQDAQSVAPFQVRHTDPDSYLDDLARDEAAGDIEGDVRLSIVRRVATLEQITGNWQPGGNRPVTTYRACYVESSYLARNQLVKLSAYCGVAFLGKEPASQGEYFTNRHEYRLKQTAETAERVSSTMRRVQLELTKRKLTARGGGMYIEEGNAAWVADWQETIEAAPEPECATCHDRIYFANGSWRHASTRRPDATRPEITKRGNTILALDHLADPEEVGRTI